MKRLNHCRGSGANTGGGTQGGMRRSNYNKVACPHCGKRLQVTKQGRLRAHGRLIKEQSMLTIYGCGCEAWADEGETITHCERAVVLFDELADARLAVSWAWKNGGKTRALNEQRRAFEAYRAHYRTEGSR